MVARATRAALITACALALERAASSGQAAQPSPSPPGTTYTVVARDGRRPLPYRVVNGHEMVALEDLAPVFQLTVREDPLTKGLTVSTRAATIVLSGDQGLASVGGRLVSLPSAPVRDGRRWLVPVEFLNRALTTAAGTPIELRKPSKLVLVGDVRLPRVAVRHEVIGSIARISLDIAPKTPHTIAQDGPRVIVRFESDGIDPTIPPITPHPLVAGIRVLEGAPALAIDVGPRFGAFRSSDAPTDTIDRVTIELTPATTELAPGGPPAAAPPEAAPLIEPAPASAIRTVVIDPGHGGEEEGARGAGGTVEKHLTLAVARRLKAVIEGRLGIRVLLTREDDRTVRLDGRAAIANNNKADLFISLHANASVRPQATGAEVFYLSLDEYGSDARRLASGEGEALPVFSGGTRDIEVILWEMAQARHIAESAAFAAIVEEQLRGRLEMSARAIQQAPFRVLVGANMPAVLVEMGFITNPEQERKLSSEVHQEAIAQALYESIVRYRGLLDAAARREAGSAPGGGHQ
jgi:N-acetylmuramoyl-L-alanine amidase